MSKLSFWNAPLGALVLLASACGPSDAPGELDANTPAAVEQAFTGSRADYVSTLYVGEGHWGNWTEPVYCNKGSWAIGYQMRVEADQGTNRDDTALNAVSLHCASKTPTSTVEWLTPSDGLFGEWGEPANCAGEENFLTSARMRLEGNRGSNRDDTAANDISFGCRDGGSINAGNGAQWGEWGSWLYCPDNTAVCGLSVRIEPNQGPNRDDTGMNGLRLYCCSL